MLSRRCRARFFRLKDFTPMKSIVFSSVLKLFPNASADLKLESWSDGHVTGVKQAVDVAPQKKAVARFVLASVGIRSDVRRLQCG